MAGISTQRSSQCIPGHPGRFSRDFGCDLGAESLRREKGQIDAVSAGMGRSCHEGSGGRAP